MKYSFHSIYNRLHENKKYVNANTILLVDIFLSVMSSFITLLFADSFIINLSQSTYVVIIGGSCVFSLLVFWGLRVNRNIIRHATIKSIGKMGFAIFLKELLLAGMILVSGSRLFGQHLFACAVIDFLVTSVILVGFRVTLVLVYDFTISLYGSGKTRVLVYGTGDKSVALKTRMHTSKHYHVVGFVNPDRYLKSCVLSELPVYYFEDEQHFSRFVKKYNINGVLYPSREEARQEADRLVRFC